MRRGRSRVHGQETQFVHNGLAGLCLLVAAVVGGCTHAKAPAPAAPPASPALPTELRVGIAPIYPPLAFKEKGELKGLDVDFAHHLAKDLNLKVTFVELPWDGLIPALRSNRIDVIMSGMSITPQRSELVSFTDWYVKAGQMALIRKADYDKLRQPGSMETSRVGFQSNSTGEFYAREHLKKAKLKGYRSLDAGIKGLRAKQIDFFVYDAPAIWRLRGQLRDQYSDLMGRYHPLTDERLAWAVRKDDQLLRDRLNATLEHWKKDGQLESMLDYWIPVRKVTVLMPE